MLPNRWTTLVDLWRRRGQLFITVPFDFGLEMDSEGAVHKGGLITSSSRRARNPSIVVAIKTWIVGFDESQWTHLMSMLFSLRGRPRIFFRKSYRTTCKQCHLSLSSEMECEKGNTRKTRLKWANLGQLKLKNNHLPVGCYHCYLKLRIRNVVKRTRSCLAWRRCWDPLKSNSCQKITQMFNLNW